MATTQLSARILVEAAPEDIDRIRLYVIGALKASCRHIREGAVAITIYDENDTLIGSDISGTPSEEFQDRIETSFFESEETPR